jgi:hypothetical protein
MNAYNDAVDLYFSRPPASYAGAYCGAAGDLKAGIRIGLRASVGSDQKLHEVGFRAFACPHIIAACQRLTETLEGQPVAALGEIDWLGLQQMFAMPVEKAGKLLILQDALKNLHAAIGARAELETNDGN